MSWFKKLTGGLKKSSEKISDGVSGIFTKDTKDEIVEAVEETQEISTEELPKSIAESPAEQIPDTPQEELSENTTEEAEERAPEPIEEKTPEPPEEKLPENIPENITEEPEEKLPESPKEEIAASPEEPAEEPKKLPKSPEKPIEEKASKKKSKTPKKKTSGGITGFFTKKKLNESMLQDLEDLLITADLGVDTAIQITDKLRNEKFDKEVSEEEIKEFLADEITEILEPVTEEIKIQSSPQVILVVGVNGNGKTTSIGKIANNLRQQGKKTMIVAADTFRAAAVEQLEEWGKRAKVPVFTGQPNQDPASVAYQAIEQAKNEEADVLLIDTAGRLQNKTNLMKELEKISNVCKKIIPDAPHNTILVLDATTGQNAISQVEQFTEAANLTGLLVTKLDGTAKGGIVVALAQKFDLKLHAIGVGEGIEDLKPFNANEFAHSLFGLEN